MKPDTFLLRLKTILMVLLLILILIMLLLIKVLHSFDDLQKNTFIHPNENHAHPKVQIAHLKSLVLSFVTFVFKKKH
ncbi:Ca2+/Na+ antiporter [Roseimarinus sediminis]